MSPRPRACGRQGAGPGGGGSIPHERNHGAGDHPIPFRTRQLSPASPKVLRRQVAGGQGVPLMGDGFGPAAGPGKAPDPTGSGAFPHIGALYRRGDRLARRRLPARARPRPGPPECASAVPHGAHPALIRGGVARHPVARPVKLSGFGSCLSGWFSRNNSDFFLEVDSSSYISCRVRCSAGRRIQGFRVFPCALHGLPVRVTWCFCFRCYMRVSSYTALICAIREQGLPS